MIRLMTLISFINVISLDVFARAGGGGGSGSSGGSGDLFGGLIALVFMAVMYIRRLKLIKKAKEDLIVARKNDTSWDEAKFKEIAKETFFAYQQAWTRRDLLSVRNLLHVDYFNEANDKLNDKLKGKQNILQNIKIKSLTLMSVRDVVGQDGDMFAMEIQASMVDYTITDDGKFVESTLSRGKHESQSRYEARAKKEAEKFTEFWVFVRLRNEWLLWSIKQQIRIVSDLQRMERPDVLALLSRELESKQIDDSFLYKDGPTRSSQKQTG